MILTFAVQRHLLSTGMDMDHGRWGPVAPIQRGRKQAQGSSLASGASGENSLASEFFSVKNHFCAFQARIGERKKTDRTYLLIAMLLFSFLHSRYKGCCPKCPYQVTSQRQDVLSISEHQQHMLQTDRRQRLSKYWKPSFKTLTPHTNPAN